jgi:hypothetical protein
MEYTSTMMTIYEVTQSGDVEGRSRISIGLFAERDDAIAVRNSGIGNQGMGGSHDGEVRPRLVFSNLAEFVRGGGREVYGDTLVKLVPDKAERDKILRERALAKLSVEERILLGIGQG